MNVLVISISAPPKNGAESIQVLRYLKYLGTKASIEVVSTKVEKRGWETADKSMEIPEDINFQRVKLHKNFIFKKISEKLTNNNYPDTFFKFHTKANKIKKNLTTKPDIIYSRAAPDSSSVLGFKLKKALNIPWVMHLSDPWVDNPYKTYSPSELEYNRNMEKKCFEAADKISLTSKLTMDFYVKKYPQYEDKFLLFPNVFDEENISEKKQLNFNRKLKIAHTGNFYGKRNPKFLLDVLINLNKKNLLENIEFTFAGNIDENSSELIKKANLNQVRYIGNLSSSESLELQKDSDILFVIDKPFESEVDKCFLPSKVIDYMVARKYIIGITDKESSTENFVQNKYGKTFNYNESDSLENHLIKLIEAFNKKDSEKFEINEIDYSYSAKKNVERLYELFKKII